MEGLIFLIVLIIIGAFIVIPIMLITKMSSVKNQQDYLQRQINDISQKLMYLINQSANKDDIQQVLQSIKDLKIEEILSNDEIVEEEEIQVPEAPIVEEKQEIIYAPIVKQPEESSIILEEEILETEEEEAIIEELSPAPNIVAAFSEEPQLQ